MRIQSLSRSFSWLSLCLMLTTALTASPAQASDPRIMFELTDEPGAWFKNAAGPVAGFQSLAVATPGTEVRFTGKSNTVQPGRV